MLKKSLLSLAVATTLGGLAGCDISSTSGNSDVDVLAVESGQPGYDGPVPVSPVFAPSVSKIPFGIDFIFASAATTDGTAEVPDNTPPVTNALSDLDGMSTVAPIDIALTGALDPATVVANQTVHLVELYNSATTDALDLNDIVADATAASATVAVGPAAYEVTYLELDGGSTPTIRISPTTPLKAKTKYLVILTTGITDVSGEAIAESTEYELLSGSAPLVNPALADARTAVQGWEAIAGGYASAATGGTLTQDDVVLAYPITTTDPTTVLKNMAAPELFLTTQIKGAIALDTTGATLTGMEDLFKTGVAAGAKAMGADDATAAAQADAAYLGLLQWTGANLDPMVNVVDLNDADNIAAVRATSLWITNLVDEGYPGGGVPSLAYIVMQSVTGAGLPTNADGSLVSFDADFDGTADFTNIFKPLDPPSMRGYDAFPTSGTSQGTQLPISALGLGLPNTGALIYQGQIELPTYLDPVDPTSQWTGATALGAVLDGALGQAAGSTPPSDADGSKNVSYRYPFAQLKGYDAVPVISVLPDTTNCPKPAAGWPTVIYMHGITSDRSSIIAIGNTLAQPGVCHATVGIDLVGHGIAPQSSDNDGARIVNTVMATGLNADNNTNLSATFDNIAERHDQLALDATNTATAIVYDDPATTDTDESFGTSGELFIQLTNFQRTRDHMRQSVLDFMNLAASLDDMDVNGAGDTFDPANVYFAGISLGSILGSQVVALVNDPDVRKWRGVENGGDLPMIKAATLAVPGGQVVKLLENSPSFAPTILGGLEAAAGLQQGDSSLESFFTTFQATIDSSEPLNFADSLAASDTPLLVMQVVGGGSFDPQTDSPRLPSAVAAGGMYPSDIVVPNNATDATGPLGSTRAESQLAPMAGTKGLIDVFGLTELTAANDGTYVDLDADNNPTGNNLQVVSQFKSGTHGTFAAGDDAAAFAEMMGQMISFFGSDGTAVIITDETVMQD